MSGQKKSKFEYQPMIKYFFFEICAVIQRLQKVIRKFDLQKKFLTRHHQPLCSETPPAKKEEFMCDRTALHTKTSLKMTRDYAKVLPGCAVEALIMEIFKVRNPRIP